MLCLVYYCDNASQLVGHVLKIFTILKKEYFENVVFAGKGIIGKPSNSYYDTLPIYIYISHIILLDFL